MTLYGCMTKDEKVELEKITKVGLEYAEEKYGEDYEVVDSSYEYQESILWPTNTGDVSIELDNGTKVIYLSTEKKFYDNFQADDILEAIEQEIWNPLLEQLEPYDFADSGEIRLSVNDDLVNESEEGFFHEYYEGDIKAFMEKERPWFDVKAYEWQSESWVSTYLCLISETDKDWQDRASLINDISKKYFKEENYIFEIAALTPELFDRVREEDGYIDIGQEGCWALGEVYELKKQNYIEVMDGIYVTSSEDGFYLEEGDIVLKEAGYSITEIQKAVDAYTEAVLKESGDATKYTINSLTPLYEMEFSDRVKQQFEGENICLYVKYVSDEADLSEESVLYMHPYIKDSFIGMNYEVVAADTTDGESQNVSVNKKEDKDYFWIGTMTSEKVFAETTD